MEFQRLYILKMAHNSSVYFSFHYVAMLTLKITIAEYTAQKMGSDMLQKDDNIAALVVRGRQPTKLEQIWSGVELRLQPSDPSSPQLHPILPWRLRGIYQAQ